MCRLGTPNRTGSQAGSCRRLPENQTWPVDGHVHQAPLVLAGLVLSDGGGGVGWEGGGEAMDSTDLSVGDSVDAPALRPLESGADRDGDTVEVDTSVGEHVELLGTKRAGRGLGHAVAGSRRLLRIPVPPDPMFCDVLPLPPILPPLPAHLWCSQSPGDSRRCG